MKKKIVTSLFFTLLLSVVFANVSFAAIGLNPDLYPNGVPTINGNVPDEDVQSVEFQRFALTRKITSLVFGVASIVAIFFIVQNGWSMAASAGSEEKVTQAKKGLTWAAIGLVLIILSYSIIRFVITIPFQADEEASPPAAAATNAPPAPTDVIPENSLQGVSTAGDAVSPAQQPASPIPQPQGEPVPDGGLEYS